MSVSQLLHYRLDELIHKSDRTLVYRGRNGDNGQSVIVKVMRNEYPSFNELVKFRNQYAIAKNLDMEGIVKCYALERHDNRYALIMEDFGGISLPVTSHQLPVTSHQSPAMRPRVGERRKGTRIEPSHQSPVTSHQRCDPASAKDASGQTPRRRKTQGNADQERERASNPVTSHQLPYSIAEFLDIAIQLAEILHQLHSNRVIHKDIKPANILIHPKTRKIKLFDFSISTLLPKETQTIQTPNILEGTLAYLSPEQTGRMNRGIDYRSDFYSLGVTFYELLTGKRPFESEDPLELVHAHIAKTPPQPPKPNPQPLIDIVMKLMAKNPEDRYQNALGLKYDLEKCRQQWQEKGQIVSFVLGERDLCDRFLIPEKLYGREKEVQTLLAAFERVVNPPQPSVRTRSGTSLQPHAEMILVAGYSGVGKTAVINEIHKPIARQRGYFIKGKFDQFQRNIPFSAFVQAFRDLTIQLLGESDTQLQRWKEKILAAVGENGQVIIEAIPELSLIIGEQPTVAELDGNAAQNRFNLLFQKFTREIATPEHPLVLFLDDLQWVDAASLHLMQLLMEDSETSHLLLVGAYRDNEVSPTHPFILALANLRKKDATIEEITLAPLPLVDLNCLVADTLSCDREQAKRLTELVWQKTQGNPFFATQFLKALHEEGCITFDLEMRSWQYDILAVQELALDDNVVEFMTGRLQKLPASTREVLSLAACIGNQFDLETLGIIRERSPLETATDLWPALREGLVLPENSSYKLYQESDSQQSTESEQLEQLTPNEQQSPRYKFLHDRIQQAAYSLIPEQEKQATHLKIGRQLWHNLPESDREEQIFTLVNHLNIGKDLVSDPAECKEIAQLNRQAAQKAKMSVAYESSRRYCYVGQEFLGEKSWQENYSLKFELAIATIEMEYFNHNLPVAQELAIAALEQVQNTLDRIKVCELQILFKITQNQMNEAISLAVDALADLDIHIPTEAQSIQTEIESLRQAIALSTEEIAHLITRPTLQDEEKLAAIRILTNASSAAYIANPSLYPVIALYAVQYCLQYGHSPLASSVYSWYGALLCGVYNEIEAGYEFGKLSLKLLEKYKARALTAKVGNMFNAFVRPWKEHLKNSVAAFPDAIQGGFNNGDNEYAFYSANHYCNFLFYSGNPLDEVYQAQERYLQPIVKAKYEFNQGWLGINQQAVANLLGQTETPQRLNGSALDREKYLAQWLENDILFLLACFYEAQTRLAYLFADIPGAVEAGEQGWQYRQATMGTFYFAEHNFYYSLALLAQEELTPQQEERVSNNQEQLKLWATFCPANFQHKFYLVEAERDRHLGHKTEAIENYDRAIAIAQEYGYIHEEALANERAAKFCLNWGKTRFASIYLQEAYYGYARWGAKAKIDALERDYPQLLAPILTPKPHYTAARTLASTSTRVGDVLDFTALMKASRTLSREIDRDRAVANLMQVIQESAGAEMVALMLFHEDTLMLEAKIVGSPLMKGGGKADGQTEIVERLRVEQSNTVPLAIINTVKHTQTSLTLDNATDDPTYARDTYIQEHQPRSILCLPLRDRGQLIGILYLENNQTTGAFTSDRVEVLELLCAQAAITLENARLYQQAQQTLKLERDLHQLQQTQLTLIQSEKMFSLGQMVAGIAHEINNPVTFIHGNIAHAHRYVQDLIGLLDLYQCYHPQTHSDIHQEIEAIDLEFLKQDLPNLLSSMRVGTDRIQKIVSSLRTFARLDESEFKAVDLQVGMESTLTILQTRLQQQDNREEIKVIKEYGNLPLVECYAGQLNQVFINMFNNAIDALEECDRQDNLTLRIRTETDGNQVKITIADNGMGMSEETKERLFDPFFTTKEVGKGTGLGMAIAYQIITEKHGGAIACHSELGKGTEFVISLPID